MNKPVLFTGSGVAIITPMHKDGSVHYEAFAKHIEYVLQGGSDAIIVCGTTGEASSLNDTEHLSVIEFCIKTVNKRVPVIAGTGSNDTQHGVELSKEAARLGVDGLLQVTPYYNKTNQSGLIQHFTKIVDEANLPTILYNVPSRTGMSIKPSTYQILAEHPQIVATKEASSDISHIAQVAATCKDTLAIYSGNDDQVVPIMSLGGLGVITVMGNVAPQKTHDICDLFFKGKLKESCALQLECLALNNALFADVNPIPVKAAVGMLGFGSGSCRLPLGELSKENYDLLEKEMKNSGLI